jgi:hypothetical protein
MVEMPKEVMELMNSPQSVKVISTISADGKLHSIRVGSLIAVAPNMAAVGAIMMKTSSKNMESMKKKGQEIALLVNADMKAYLIMAKVKEAQKSGPLFDKMNENMKAMNLHAEAVWVFEPTGVWNESASRESGTKIA